MADTSSERNIVIAMDGSHFSAYAFEWYVSNVHRKGDHVIIVHCQEGGTPFSSYAPDPYVLLAFQKEEEKKTKEILDSLGGKLRDAQVCGRCISEIGDPGHVVVKIAEAEGAHMIVTGCRGLGTIRRTFMGSVSDYIMHHSPVPVIVCRHKEDLKPHGHTTEEPSENSQD